MLNVLSCPNGYYRTTKHACLTVNLFVLQPAFNNIFEFIFCLKNIKFDVFYVFLDNFDIIILKIK
jgi:hypothetical protein